MDVVRSIIDVVVDQWSSFFLSATGLVSNTVNIVVFCSLGFRESSNISLMLIAVIDWIKCLAGFLHRGYTIAGPFDELMGINWKTVTYLINTHVQNLCVPLVNITTMYLTVERCLCLCLPLRVKSLVTPNVTACALGALSFLVTLTILPMYATFYLTWVVDTPTNRTLARYIPLSFYQGNGVYAAYINYIYIIWNTLSFATIITCTSIIVMQLQRHWTFRSRHINTGNRIEEMPSKIPCKNRKDIKNKYNSGQNLSTINNNTFSAIITETLPTIGNETLQTIGNATLSRFGNETLSTRVYDNVSSNIDKKIITTEHDSLRTSSDVNTSQTVPGIDESEESGMHENPNKAYLKKAYLPENRMDSHQNLINHPKHDSSHLSSKESRLVKMLFLVVLVYMVNIIPRLAAVLTKVFLPEFGIYGKYGAIYFICFEIIFFTDLLATNTHIFIYLAMSSQFKRTFLHKILEKNWKAL